MPIGAPRESEREQLPPLYNADGVVTRAVYEYLRAATPGQRAEIVLRLVEENLRGQLELPPLADGTRAYLSHLDLSPETLIVRYRQKLSKGPFPRWWSAVLGTTDLTGADLRGADLQGAGLRGVYLEGADLRGASLQGAGLQRAYLQWADLREAQLVGTYLGRVDLRRVNLSGADLRGAYLRDALLGDTLFTGARCDSDTAWPDGFDPIAAGVITTEVRCPGSAERADSRSD